MLSRIILNRDACTEIGRKSGYYAISTLLKKTQYNTIYDALISALRISIAVVSRCQFSSHIKAVEYEIMENMRTYPLFSQKVEYNGSIETKLKYFKGSEWMKSSDMLVFNPAASYLAELIPGNVDEFNSFHISERFAEPIVPLATRQYEVVKSDVDTFLAQQPHLYVQDGQLGSTQRSNIHVRSVTNDPTIALILKSLMFSVTDVRAKNTSEYKNNLTLYISKGHPTLENCLTSQLTSDHTYSLLINGDCSIRQLIDEIAAAANTLYYENNHDIAEITTDESTVKDAINTVVVPCSCIRAKNNVSSFIFSNDNNINTVSHEHLDEIHRHALTTGSLFSLDHTVISNNSVNALFGGIQLSERIGTLVHPTESIFVNDSVMINTINDSTCSLPSTLLFIQQAMGMKEMSYDDFYTLVKTWNKPDDMTDYLLAWTKVSKAECFRISSTIMKDVIVEMETIGYNEK